MVQRTVRKIAAAPLSYPIEAKPLATVIGKVAFVFPLGMIVGVGYYRIRCKGTKNTR